MKQQGRSKERISGIYQGLMLIFLLILLLGCTNQYAYLQRDDAVTHLFRTNSVPETYRYYTDGRTDIPYAIIGIDPRFELVPHLWAPLEPNSDAFARKVAFLWLPEDWTRYPSGQGAYIEDKKGNRIGIWYSMYPYATITVDVGGRVEVYSPGLKDGSEPF